MLYYPLLGFGSNLHSVYDAAVVWLLDKLPLLQYIFVIKSIAES